MEHVKQHDYPYARDYNAMVDRVRGGFRATGIGVHETSHGIFLSGKRWARIGLFELTTAFTMPDPGTYSAGDGDVPYSDEAQPVWLNDKSTVNEYSAASESSTGDYKLYAPNGFLNASDVVIGHPPATTGQRVWAVLNNQSGRWEVLNTPVDIWRFELKDNLTPDSASATAYLLPCTGGTYGEDTDIEFEVYDPLKKRRGRAKGAEDGSQGYAKWMPDSGRWEIIDMQPHALVIAAQVDNASGIAATDATMAIDNVVVIQPTGGLLMSTPSLADNLLAMPYADNARVICLWHEEDEDWLALGAISTTTCA